MHRLPFPDAAPATPDADWQAAWIWSRDATDGVHSYVYFRRAFDLAAPPTQALLRLAAERDATLWVNGALIAHGPPISDPRFKRYETHDVTAQLRPGRNCIAVRVYHDQGRGAFTAHPDARGLLCQLEADGAVLQASDESWQAVVCRAYLKPVGPPFGDSMWPEHFDANQDHPGWQLPDFDAAGWPPAFRVIPRRHGLWGEEQPQARFYPWVSLLPCETRPLHRERHLPACLLAVGEVLQRREASRDDVALRLSLETVQPLHKASVGNAEALLTGNGRDSGSDSTAATTIRNSDPRESGESFDGIRNATIILDFGRLMNARFGVALATGGATIDIGYAYALEDGRVVPYTSNRAAMADHYIARPGEQEWETADWRHFRYVQLTFRNLADALTLRAVWADEITNHAEPRGRFACSDPALVRVWDAVRRATALNIVDRTMDNPSRERKQYLGDCSAIIPALTHCFGDAALVRRYFANVREGQHITGQYRYSYPGHNDDRASLFDHALSAPLRLWEHLQQFDDRDMLAPMWPGLERFLEFAASCVDADDMMVLPPYNIWFDWGHMDRRGHFLPLQAMTAEAFRRAADIATSLGQPAERWRDLAARLTAQIPRWWDAERGVFVDAIVDGQRQTHCSEHALSLLASWDLAPANLLQTALATWDADPQRFGQVSPAWAYLPGGFIHAGRTDLAIRWLHGRLAALDRAGIDTWPETWCRYGEATLGPWRCRNSRAVAQGAGLGAAPAFLGLLCGIQPAEPGFRSLRLAPQPGPLTLIAGTLPGPDGDYSLRLERRDGAAGKAEWQLDLALPSPRPVVLDAAFAPSVRSATLNGAPLAASAEHTMPSGVAVGRFAWQASAHSTLILAANPG